MTVRLAITGDRNTGSKRDWSGAFAPEAARYVAGGDSGSAVVTVPLDARSEMQRGIALRAIAEHAPTELAFFCHGFTRRIQLGFSLVHLHALAAALSSVGCDRVALYACSTGGGPGVGGDGGFADALRDALCTHGLTSCRVLAHRTPGHASMNPRKALFEGRGSPVGGVGGTDIVRPGSTLWRRWCTRLRAPGDPLRWQLLSMEIGEIHRDLA